MQTISPRRLEWSVRGKVLLPQGMYCSASCVTMRALQRRMELIVRAVAGISKPPRRRFMSRQIAMLRDDMGSEYSRREF